MKSQAQNEKNLFDGILSTELRTRLKDKRLRLGLPYQAMARLFGVDWSTIRKWERGPTKRCSVTLRPKLIDFLNGKYDEMLKAENEPKVFTYKRGIPDDVLYCMERFSKAYQLLRYRPDLRENLLDNVEKITNEMLKSMIERKSGKPDPL
ncbi:MAG: transcriptional regulator [Oligosphaeraceae bacterium]|nr:transcriptional regulator [Oligosphaeraceae bacterium]